MIQVMMRRDILVTIALAMAVLLLPGVSLSKEPDVKKSRGQTVYVPVYSSVYYGVKEQTLSLTATLSIRNTHPIYPIMITAVEYYDSDGKMLRHYVDKPIQLKAMASTHFVISESDKAGGVGANFIVKWLSGEPVPNPVIESVMIGTRSQQGISFVSVGKVIDEVR